MAGEREKYLKELETKTALLAKQIEEARKGRGDARRVRELQAAQTACSAASWLLANPHFRADLESIRGDREKDRKALAKLAASEGEFARFLAAESEFLRSKNVRRSLVSAVIDDCRDLAPKLLDDTLPGELASRLETLRDTVCEEHRKAVAGLQRPGRLRSLTRRVSFVLGGGLVIAFNKAGGLAIVVQTMGAAAPAVAIADSLSTALGTALIAKGAKG